MSPAPSAVFTVASPFQARLAIFPATSFRLGVLGLLLLLGLAPGCDFLPPRPPLGPPQRDRFGDLGMEPEAETEPAVAAVPAEPWGSWQLYVRDGQPVGCSHARAEPASDESSRIRYEVDDQITIRRGRASVVQRLQQRFTESLDGELIELESSLRVGPAVANVTASVRDDELEVEVERGLPGRSQTRSLDWGPDHRGPLAIANSLRARPLTPGQSRTLKWLQPIGLRVVEVRLECVGEAVVPGFDSSNEKLLEINRLDLEDGEVVARSVLWTDRAGRIRKTLVPALDLVAYAVTAQQAAAVRVDEATLDTTAEVEVEGTIPAPAEASRVLYEVELLEAGEKDELDWELEPAPGQQVSGSADAGWKVLVAPANTRPVKRFRRYASEVTAADTAPSSAIDYRSRAFRKLESRTLRTTGLSDAEVAAEMAAVARSAIQSKPVGVGITAASQVAKRLSGDSLAHSILLTALLRAKQIPARVVLGMRYHQDEDARPTMQFCAWTAAWYEEDWHPLDPLLGGPPSADRIALEVIDLSDGSGEAAHDALLRLVDRIGQLRIAVEKTASAKP